MVYIGYVKLQWLMLGMLSYNGCCWVCQTTKVDIGWLIQWCWVCDTMVDIGHLKLQWLMLGMSNYNGCWVGDTMVDIGHVKLQWLMLGMSSYTGCFWLNYNGGHWGC